MRDAHRRHDLPARDATASGRLAGAMTSGHRDANTNTYKYKYKIYL
jgi:hypothetical protein